MKGTWRKQSPGGVFLVEFHPDGTLTERHEGADPSQAWGGTYRNDGLSQVLETMIGDYTCRFFVPPMRVGRLDGTENFRGQAHGKVTLTAMPVQMPPGPPGRVNSGSAGTSGARAGVDAIGDFVSDLMSHLDLPDDPEVVDNIRQDLTDRAVDTVNRALTDAMSDHAVTLFNLLLDQEPANPQRIQDFVAANVKDAQGVSARALGEFRRKYIKG